MGRALGLDRILHPLTSDVMLWENKAIDGSPKAQPAANSMPGGGGTDGEQRVGHYQQRVAALRSVP